LMEVSLQLQLLEKVEILLQMMLVQLIDGPNGNNWNCVVAVLLHL
jgi:hypothetical protein